MVAVVVVHDPGPGSTRRSRRSPARTTPTCASCSCVVGDPDPELLDAVGARIRSFLPAAFIRAIAGNPGFGPAANEVLRLVEGDNGFFLLCHDDIAPASDAVRTMVTELYRSNAGMVGPKLVEWDEPRRLQHVGLGLDRFGEVDPIVEPGEVDQEQHDAVRDVFVLPSACMLVRADLFRELRGFDPAVSFHGDDVDLCWRAHHHGARVVVAPDARVRHLEDCSGAAPGPESPPVAGAAPDARGRDADRRLAARRSLGPDRVADGRRADRRLFTGRFGEALSSLRALFGLIPRSFSFSPGVAPSGASGRCPNARCSACRCGAAPASRRTYGGVRPPPTCDAGMTVRRWRETSFGPLLTWFVVLVAMVDRKPHVLRSAASRQSASSCTFPDSPAELAGRYTSAGTRARSASRRRIPRDGWRSRR